MRCRCWVQKVGWAASDDVGAMEARNSPSSLCHNSSHTTFKNPKPHTVKSDDIQDLQVDKYQQPGMMNAEALCSKAHRKARIA